MKRILLLPLILILGCESVGSAYHAMSPVLQAVIMALVALAIAITARYVLPRKPLLATTE